MQTTSISNIQQNLHKLEDFNIIEIVDKKQKNNLLNIVGIIDSGEKETKDTLRDERLSRITFLIL